MRRSTQSAEDFHLPSLTFEHRSAGETALSTLRRTIETDCSRRREALSLDDSRFKIKCGKHSGVVRKENDDARPAGLYRSIRDGQS